MIKLTHEDKTLIDGMALGAVLSAGIILIMENPKDKSSFQGIIIGALLIPLIVKGISEK